MTICVSVRVAEGLVLSADSVTALMTSVPNQQGQIMQAMVQSFNYANKVTHFKDYPVGILTWGLASIEARSIQSLIGEFEYSYPSREAAANDAASIAAFTVRGIAEALTAFIGARVRRRVPPVRGEPARSRAAGRRLFPPRLFLRHVRVRVS